MPRAHAIAVVCLLCTGAPSAQTRLASPDTPRAAPEETVYRPGTAAVIPRVWALPDTSTIPPDSLESPEPGEEPSGDIVYAEVGDVNEEEEWNLFEFPAWFGLRLTGGFCATGNYESVIGGALTYGKPIGENGWLEISAGYTATPLQQSSSLRETINGSPGMFSMAGDARAFLMPSGNSMRIHLLFGLGVDFLFWTYNTPINTAADEGGVHYVSDDSLPGLDFHLGVGFTLVRDSGLLVTGEITPGVKLWFDETRNGFTNDLFSSYGFVLLRLQAALEIGG